MISQTRIIEVVQTLLDVLKNQIDDNAELSITPPVFPSTKKGKKHSGGGVQILRSKGSSLQRMQKKVSRQGRKVL